MKKILVSLSVLFSAISFSQTVNMSNGSTTTCNATFYDSGGPAGNYGNNENLSHTFFPATPGQAIELTFSSYVSGVADQISIYDGPDNTYPLLFMDGGTLSIPTFISTDFTGALTIEFNSNGMGNQAGWVASVSCCASPQIWFADLDGDGFGSMWDFVFSCTAPTGYVSNGDDCDDMAILFEDADGDGFGNPLIQSGCGVPDNTDCDDDLLTYEDLDGDSFGNPNVFAACGVLNATDCDDSDAGVGAGTMSVYFADMDGDGYGDPWNTMLSCAPVAGYVSNNDDCDDFAILYQDLDGDGFGNPAVQSACGSYYNTDCNDAQWTYADNDGDGFGDPNIPEPCGIADNTDCDDTDSGIGGGITMAYYSDNDGDGFGDPWNYIFACSPPAGYVTDSSDCDDWAIMYPDNDGDGFGVPGAPVACGSYEDSDCDDNLLTYADNDGDNFGDPNNLVPCGISDNTDCDDFDASVGGGVVNAYYQDWDGDTYGAQDWPVYSCTPIVGMVTDNSDCDDFDSGVNPGVSEIAGNGIDDNCDGITDPVSGIQDDKTLVFSIYPNPADDFVYVSYKANELISVKVINLSGQAVSYIQTAKGNNEIVIDLQGLPAGIYFVQLYGGDQIQTAKLIVN